MKKFAFTLTEILLAIAIVGVIAAILLPIIITKYQNKAFDLAFDREVQTIRDLIRELPISEHVGDFNNTKMYLEKTDENTNYDEYSGYFLRKYFRVAKYCGSEPGKCFSNAYYTYNKREKNLFNFNVSKHSCALLKNGMSICISPQIVEDREPINIWIDLNGPKGPNIVNRDLREIDLDYIGEITVATSNKDIQNYCKEHPDADVCGGEESPIKCSDKTITSYNDECCDPTIHPESPWLNNDVCKSPVCPFDISNVSKDCCNSWGIYNLANPSNSSIRQACCKIEEFVEEGGNDIKGICNIGTGTGSGGNSGEMNHPIAFASCTNRYIDPDTGRAANCSTGIEEAYSDWNYWKEKGVLDEKSRYEITCPIGREFSTLTHTYHGEVNHCRVDHIAANGEFISNLATCHNDPGIFLRYDLVTGQLIKCSPTP